jgi:hypothetical protein
VFAFYILTRLSETFTGVKKLKVETCRLFARDVTYYTLRDLAAILGEKQRQIKVQKVHVQRVSLLKDAERMFHFSTV